MSNPFDTLGEYDDDLGFLKKIKKAFRKVEKKVNKARRSLRKKILPGKIADKMTKLEKNPKLRKIAKIAAGAAAIYFTGGAALGAVKAGVGKIAASGLAKKALMTGAKMMVTQKLQAGGRSGHSVQDMALDDRVTLQQMEADAAEIQRLQSTPEFREIYNQLASQGASPQQILNTWHSSEKFKQVAIPGVARAVYPQLEQTYRQELPPQLAQQKAMIDSYDIAQQEVEKQSGIDTKTLLTIGVPIVAALLLRG